MHGGNRHVPWGLIRWGIVTLLTVYVIIPLLVPGFIPTHDGEYHLIRIWQFGKMLGSGYLFPRWAPDINSGYGLPLFNFQYPFPNYVGALWHRLGWSLADSVKLTLAAGYAGSVIFCAFWLSELFSPLSAWAGTVFFMFVPYWFVDIYVRGSVGETLAMMWVMMALWATEKKYAAALSVSIGLLIVTHNISAMLFVPLITLYVLVRRIRLWPAILTGIGLAAYFWFPALVEKRYMTGLNTTNFRDYFPRLDQLLVPSWGTGFSGGMIGDNDMSAQIGIVPMLIFLLSFFAVIRDGVRKKTDGRTFFWGAILMVSLVMMQEASQPVWEAFPFLSFIQYPWRFLSFVIVTSAFFGAYVSTRLPRVITILLLLGAVAATTAYVRPVTYAARNDAYYLSRKNFTDGTSSLGNALSTIWTGWKQTRPPAPVTLIGGEATISEVAAAPLMVAASVQAGRTSTVQINRLYYPGWTAKVDGRAVSVQNSAGVLRISVPAGEHRIVASFHETPWRLLADIVSLASLAYLGYTMLQVYAHRHKHTSPHDRP